MVGWSQCFRGSISSSQTPPPHVSFGYSLTSQLTVRQFVAPSAQARLLDARIIRDSPDVSRTHGIWHASVPIGLQGIVLGGGGSSCSISATCLQVGIKSYEIGIPASLTAKAPELNMATIDESITIPFIVDHFYPPPIPYVNSFAIFVQYRRSGDLIA